MTMGPGGLDSPRDPFSTPRGDWDLYFLYTKVGEKISEIARESYSKKGFLEVCRFTSRR